MRCKLLLQIIRSGGYGSNNDSDILLNSEMGKGLEVGEKMNLQIAEDLDGCDYKPLPYYFLGDEVFPLRDPSPERIWWKKSTTTDNREVVVLLKILSEF